MRAQYRETALRSGEGWTRQLKVLHVITRSERGGAQSVVLTILNGLQDKIEFALAVGSDDDQFLRSKAMSLGICTFELKSMRRAIDPLCDARALVELVNVVRAVRPDVIHCHSSKAGVIGRIAARLCRVPVIFTAHGWAFADGVSVARRQLTIGVERLLAYITDKVLVVSKQDEELALRNSIVPHEKLLVVRNGLPDSTCQAEPGHVGLTRIAMVARFAPPKDQELLLRALASLGNLQFEAVFVGDGPQLSDMIRLSKELGIDRKVEFLGLRSDIPQILADSHIFVLTSSWEGLPVSIIEAMRAGLPVISSDVGGSRELVVDGETGYLIPRADEQMLSVRLAELINSSYRRRSFGEASRTRYLEEFTDQLMLARTFETYAGLSPR